MNWYDYILVPLYLSLFLAALVIFPILVAKIISLVKDLKEDKKELKCIKGEKYES